jgi:uncharacterized protein (DUF885 family)
MMAMTIHTVVLMVIHMPRAYRSKPGAIMEPPTVGRRPVSSPAVTSPAAGDARTATPIDERANRFVDEYCALDPLAATAVGVAGHDADVTDLSPEGLQARADLERRVLADLDALGPVDDVDDVTLAAMRDRLGLNLQIYDAGLAYGDLNVIASPLQGLREVFDLMPTATAEHWDTVATRLGRLEDGVRGYVESLRRSVRAGRPPARRQVEACAEQAEQFADPEDGFFARFAQGARLDGDDQGTLSEALAADLDRGAKRAAAAYTELARYLREELLPVAPGPDAVGREEYALWSQLFVGARVDLEETYAWGQEELARIEAEMRAVADRIVPGGSVADAEAALDADPDRRITGKEAFRDWMQAKSDAAVDALADVHFDIPEPVRRLECMIAPTTSGGIYYTGPSEDFSRPGRMWWAVPDGVEDFATWQQTTTVFHEGVPGHHLQIAQTLYRKELLNRWRRIFSWSSGHGEGWALYAERLMADLGWLDDPGDRLGMLDGSRFRAMRVVVDIGLHCGFEAPAEVGGGAWDADKMWRFMRAHCMEPEPFLRFEQLRYLGWPGQAPSYKVGERLWLQLRDQVRAAEGDAFDLKAFHRRALDVGSLPLSVMAEALT